MEVCFKYKKYPKTGKGKFGLKLAAALNRQGISIVDSRGDIDLQFGKWNYKPNARKNVIRLGPAHVDINQNYKKLNTIKWKSIKKTDGIVYQSHYSKKICRKFIGRPAAREKIIPNGSEPINIDPIRNGNDFICITRKWLPQKRLKVIEKAFLKSNISGNLLVCGNTLGHKRKGIKYLDMVEEDTLQRLLRSVRAMIHIVYLDAAPNSVVEALVAGCPVITTDQGGTHEMIKHGINGYVLKDKIYKFKPTDLSRPPKLDIKILSNAMNAAIEHEWNFDSSKYYIDNIAKRYINYFKELL